MATPFLDESKFSEDQDDLPGGELSHIASRVLMKVLYGARMARWDLLRATCALAAKVTKWSDQCDAQLHRLVSYINSSLELKMYCWIGYEHAEGPHPEILY